MPYSVYHTVYHIVLCSVLYTNTTVCYVVSVYPAAIILAWLSLVVVFDVVQAQ